ncbi:MAG: hypothetical protein FWD61_08320 [Phycisphaerales bacterium]|nr:hypothetical protein [Phycisphaerales bacterium]
MNFFNQGIPLGRWFGITVVIHWTFLLYAAMKLFAGGEGGQVTGNEMAFRAMFMGLLFATVLMHEFGHALSCKAVGGQALHIVLWPLGGIAFVQPPMNPWAWLVTTACGPLVNAILWPVFWVITMYGLPMLEHVINPHTLLYEIIVNVCLIMVYINRLLLLFNLIPGYPMDGGRLLQEILWLLMGYQKSLQIAGMVGTVVGVGFVVLGLGMASIKIPFVDYTLGQRGGSEPMLIIIGILVAMQSFGIYKQSQMIQGWRKR